MCVFCALVHAHVAYTRLTKTTAKHILKLGEKLRDFFARTTEYWTHRAVEEVDRRAAAATQAER